MKFGKNLQRVVDISDPAWSPYWLSYKSLKKLIKNLITAEEANNRAIAASASADDSDTSSIDENLQDKNGRKRVQQVGDATGEQSPSKRPRRSTSEQYPANGGDHDATSPPLGQNPGEVAFFKALHAELKKVEWFFGKAVREHEIRFERVRHGMDITKKLKNQSSMEEKWKIVSKAMYHLYKDLLLLETFAILTYVGFSKILKKHDKVTGYRTCNSYMESIVNQSNFTHYPKLMSMIKGCDNMYEEISRVLEQERQKLLSEDEKLFISMIQQWNVEVLGDEKQNGASPRPSSKSVPEKAESQAVGDLRELLSEDESAGTGIVNGGLKDQNACEKSIKTSNTSQP